MSSTAAWLLTAAALSVLMLLVPESTLEYLSLHVVGEPPINGKTWAEGMHATGGPWGMRWVGIVGLWIMGLGLVDLRRWQPAPWSEREVANVEVVCWAAAAVTFGVVNMAIGYSWWDPQAFLGMGPLFPHSIASLAVLGVLPILARRFFGIPGDGLATLPGHTPSMLPILVVVAFGYGLWSCLWHCCVLFAPSIVFFYLVTKLFQLSAVCVFFFGWGLPMFGARWGSTAAYLVTGATFGLCYPWHTPGFALVFAVFGVVLCDLARRAGSWLAPTLLLYMAYNFHAALPWNGADVTVYGILPASVVLLVALATRLRGQA